MSFTQLAAFVAVVLMTLTRAQESCVFGDDDDCHFPCHCEPALIGPGVDTPCNRTTGHCHSLKCPSTYALRVLNDAYLVCQPSDQFFYDNHRTAAYLVHPTTMERLTGDLIGIIRGDKSNLATDCSAFLDTADIAAINDTLMWEIDLKRLYTFEKYFRFWIRTVPINLTGTVSFEFDIRKVRQESLATFPMDCSTSIHYVDCIQSSSPFYTAQYIFFKANISPLKCFVFGRGFFSNTFGYATDVDCSRCLQTDAVPCGNGYWCETCAAGWKPPDCREPCDPGYTGVNCVETYDWQGSIESVTQNGNLIRLTFTCDTAVPNGLESNYIIYVELLSRHNVQQEVPYVRGQSTVMWDGNVDDEIRVRFNLFAVFPDRTITGQPSEAFTIVTSGYTSNGSCGNTDGNESSAMVYALGVVAGACVLALICIIVLIFVIRRKNKCLMCVTVDDDEEKNGRAQSAQATPQASSQATRQRMELPVLAGNSNTGSDLNVNSSDSASIMRRNSGYENIHIYTSLNVHD